MSADSTVQLTNHGQYYTPQVQEPGTPYESVELELEFYSVVFSVLANTNHSTYYVVLRTSL